LSQQINLFNPVFLKQKKVFSAVNMVDTMAVLIVGVAAFYGYASIETLNLDRQAIETSRQYEQSKARLAQTSARYAPKKADASLEAEVKNLQAQLSARKATLDSLGIDQPDSGVSYAGYLRALARQSLGGLWLTGFRVGNGGAEMEINGRALHAELVPSYIQRLKQEQAMQGRAFDSLSLTLAEEALPAVATAAAGTPSNFSYIAFRLLSNRTGAAANAGAAPTSDVSASATQQVQSRAGRSR
jgi:hypothetical protein